ncbi:MAG: hypothetical protein AAFU79_34990 [Myxococcota bacterium]
MSRLRPSRPVGPRALHRALSDPRWTTRLTAIETIRRRRDVRFRGRLWLLSRFHLAPSPVRRAARNAYLELEAYAREGRGRLSRSDDPR